MIQVLGYLFGFLFLKIKQGPSKETKKPSQELNKEFKKN